MRRIDTTVYCTDQDRKHAPAKYKIAAEWVGGGYAELKTFGFADDECLERVFLRAIDRASKIRLSEGESLGEMRIYVLDPKQHDYELRRAVELEEKLMAESGMMAGT